MVEAEGLRKTFLGKKGEEVHALNDVSFTAKPGEVFGLIGDNGAGKTTALRIISTLIFPTAGRVRVDGKDVSANPIEVRKSLGILSGSTGLYARMTPKSFLEYFAQLFGIAPTDRESRVAEVIERFRLKDFLNRPCDQLSTGQKQRVGLARVTLHNPPVLLLDEPTAGLDVQASQGVLEFVEDCRRDGKTIIYCSHIMTEVERLCDSVVILHEGRICASGTVASLKAEAGEQSMESAFLKLIGYRPEEGAK